MRRAVTAISLATLTALVVSGCSTKAETSDPDESGGVQTDVGVDDKAIHLGILTDLSGPYKVNGLAATTGTQIWADEVNTDGGICGRDIELDVKDHGYKADSATALYAEMKSSVLGVASIVGTPILAALKQQIESDKMLATVAITGSNALDIDAIFPVTATYDIEVINGMSYLQGQGLVDDGDKVGIVHLDNEAGENSLAGLQFYAEKHDLEVVPVPVSSTDSDMTSVVTKMKSEDVDLLAVQVASASLGSIGVAMKGQGLDVPILVNSPSFSPTLVSNPEVADALAGAYFGPVGVAPYGDEGPNAQKVKAAYDEKGTSDVPTPHINLGYLSGLAWGAILDEACDAGDLTREGIRAARGKVNDLDTGGLSGNLDLSKPGASPTLETFIEQLDPSSPEGLKLVQDRFVSEEAKEYKFPFGD